MKISVSTASGVEAVTKRELYDIAGQKDLAAINGRITFEGGWKEVSECNLNLRTADRVGIVLGEFKAEDFDGLFEGIRNIPWEDFIDPHGKIVVSAKCVESAIHALSATQSIVKKAICTRLQRVYGINELAEDGERFKVEAAITRNFATITLDTSGEGLHKRGYRTLVGHAPLKETLAAAMIKLSVWNADRPFADLFCGSGTLPIEACLIAKNIPCGLNRNFDFLEWKCADKSIFAQVKQEATSNIDLKREVRISGFDIDDSQIKLALKHAAAAGVGEYIHFQRADAADFSSAKRYGVIISNLPYGERLSDRKGIEKLYRTYGKVFSSLKDWSAYTITPVDDFERLFGRKADKKRKLYNGGIECTYYAMLGEKPPRRERE